MIKINYKEFIANSKNLSKKEMCLLYSVSYPTLQKLYKELEIERESARVGRPSFKQKLIGND